ncbi:FkbM family methyltransferase [Oceanicola sp. 502str15]|uniref:FkbM family methyltransferase n=1 Tax=Oceanicola sp. 502str15 TaxID=2696061 RepID=UPI0035321D8F
MLRKLAKAGRALSDRRTRSALRHGVAASYEHEALLAGLGPLKTVIDVGANVGQFALLCRLVQPSAKVYSFEPMRAPAETFLRVLGDDPVVELHRTALGTEAGTAEINVSARADSSSLLAPETQTEIFPGTQIIGTETIRIARLSDELTRENLHAPALLKIDVQGYEGEVLKGCEELLDSFDWIYCEMSFAELYAGQPLAHELIPWLAAHGFELSSVLVDPLMVRNGRAVQADMLFVQSSIKVSTN